MNTNEETTRKVATPPSPAPSIKRRKGVNIFQQIAEEMILSFCVDAAKKVLNMAFNEVRMAWSTSHIAYQSVMPDQFNDIYNWADKEGIFSLSSKKHQIPVQNKTGQGEYIPFGDKGRTHMVPEGSYSTFKEGCLLSVEITMHENKTSYGGSIFDRKIKATIYGRDGNRFEKKLKELSKVKHKKKEIKVYDMDNPWYPHTREIRGMDSVVMGPKEKEDLLALLNWWQGSKEMHSKYGLAWKLTILMHGPPGTGKTSLAQAIAKYLNFDLALLRIDPTKMVEVKDKISRANKNTVILIEDIDRAVVVPGSEKKSEEAALSVSTLSEGPVSGTVPEVKEIETSAQAIPGIELLMNALDGVTSPDGVVVLMSTNHLERLDPALIRQGRVNKKIYMGLFDWERAKEMGNLFGVDEEFIKSLGKDIWTVPAELQLRLMQKVIQRDSCLNGGKV